MRTGWLLLLAAGCAPVIPFHLTETAETLKKGAVSLSMAGGGGGGTFGSGGGGDARVMVGVSDRQELGVEVGAVGTTGVAWLGGKLRYKLGLGHHLALIAGLGASGTLDIKEGTRSDPGLGGDLALVASSTEMSGASLYGGVRFTFVVPLARDLYKSSLGGPTQGFILPLGVAVRLAEAWRFFIEGGATLGAAEFRDGSGVNTAGLYGGYGAVAVTYSWLP